MFCGKCGSQIPKDATTCYNCGAELKPSVTVSATGAKATASAFVGKTAKFSGSFDLKNPKLLGIAAGVVAVIVLFVVLFGGQSYEKAVDNFIDGIFDADGKQVLNAFPDKVVDAMCDEADMSQKELTAELNDILEDVQDELNYYVGSNWSVSHKIVRTERYDPRDVEDIKEEYAELGINVKDAKVVIVKMTVKAAGESESMELEVGVIKVGSSWYVDAMNVDLPF